MVAVAGRSRACKTCRTRRLKCDEAKPSCSRCTKAGFQCEGYSDRNFIVYKDGAAKLRNASQSLVSRSDARRTTLETNEVTMSCMEPSSHSSVPSSSVRQAASETKLSRSISSIGFDVYAAYLQTYLLRDGGRARVMFDRVDTALCDKAFNALAATFFGFRTGSDIAAREGQECYSNALQNLRLTLGDAKPYTGHDILAAVSMLCFVEFLVPTTQDGWIKHCLGLGELFKKLGPEVCSRDPYHFYFVSTRPLIVYAHLESQNNCILADPIWLSLPWANRPRIPAEDLTDASALCCRLWWMHSLFTTKSSVQRIHQLRTEYDQLAQYCSELLKIWEPHKLQHEQQRRMLHARDDSLFTTAYYYETLQTSTRLCHYHSVVILLESLIFWKPIDPSDLYPQATTVTMVSPSYKVFLFSATEIVKSVEYNLLDIHSSAGSVSLIFPLRMALRGFNAIGLKREQEWVTHVLRDLGSGCNKKWAIAQAMVL